MPASKPISVLLVDDDPLVLTSTSRFLRRCGMRATCATSPFGVSALVLKESPDVLVLDCHMPGLDGARLARLVRATARAAATRLVFYSGDSDVGLATLARAFDARYACKGADPSALIEAIEAALQDGARAGARSPTPGSPRSIHEFCNTQ